MTLTGSGQTFGGSFGGGTYTSPLTSTIGSTNCTNAYTLTSAININK